MPIESNQWPMNILTRPVGEKDRALIVHPKTAVERKGIRKNDGEFIITNRKAIKIKPGTYHLEVKEAGHRHIFFRDDDGDYGCFGRRLNVNKTYTNIYEKICKMPLPKLPRETAVDFELIWPGHPDSEVVTAIKECPEELRMRAFSAPIYRGRVLIGDKSDDYETGRILVGKLVGSDRLVKRYKPIEIPKEEPEAILQILLNWAEKRNQEGWVLKEAACRNWYKLKGVNEADVVIIGFKVSSAETRMGMVTAVKVGVYVGEQKYMYVGNVSGFNLEEMEAMTKAYNKYDAKDNSEKNPYRYKVLRIAYQEMAGKGGLKHAFRDCWREDKSPESCFMGQFK